MVDTSRRIALVLYPACNYPILRYPNKQGAEEIRSRIGLESDGHCLHLVYYQLRSYSKLTRHCSPPVSYLDTKLKNKLRRLD